MSDEISDLGELMETVNSKNDKGTLTVSETLFFGYYKLLEGPDAGRIIITSVAKKDGKRICIFADNLTWKYQEKLADIRCKKIYPTFNDTDEFEVTDKMQNSEGDDWCSLYTCPSCKFSDIRVNSKFCNECGKKLTCVVRN